jgi:hypothetical protein
MDKDELSRRIKDWLTQFFNDNYKDTYSLLDVIIDPTVLSRINNKHIKSLANHSSWEFSPDILGIIENKLNKDIGVVFINRTVSSISLKEIGELFLYSKLAKVEFSFLVSSVGVSNEVNILLVDNDIRKRLLNFDINKNITIFTWNESININSVLPIDSRKFFK